MYTMTARSVEPPYNLDLPIWDKSEDDEVLAEPIRGKTTVKEFESEGLLGEEPEIVNLGEVESSKIDDEYFFEEIDEPKK